MEEAFDRRVPAIFFTIQGSAIIVSNAITVVVFWRRRAALKRTSYFLVNLSVADTTAGVAEILSQWLFAGYLADKVIIFWVASSILSLAGISVERLIATWKPFVHRTCSSKYYFIVIGVIWIVGLLAGSTLGSRISVVVSIALTLSTLVVSNVALWYLVVFHRGPVPRADRVHGQERTDRRTREQNKKLTKTLSVVSALSLLSWLPMAVRLAIGVHPTRHWQVFVVTNALMFTNSLVNPVVYVFRMPEFRGELKQMLCRSWKGRK